MEAILSSVTAVFGVAIEMVGTVASTIAGQPILLLSCVGVPLCGIGIGMIKRLLSAHV